MNPAISFVVQNQAGENLVETGAITEDDIKLFAKNGSEFLGRSSYTSPGRSFDFSNNTECTLSVLGKTFEVVVNVDIDKGCCWTYTITSVIIDGREVDYPNSTVTITL